MPVGDPWLVQQGGAFCITNRTQAWPGGQSEFNPPSFKEAFASEFKSAGLPIEGDPENLFDTGNSDATADFAVAGVITEFVQHYCTPNLSPSAQTNQKGSVSMTVDWEVYSRLEKQIVATVHTTGDSTLDEPKPAGLSVMTVDAFTQNVRQLAASPDLRRVLAAAPRGETELVKPDAFDKIQLWVSGRPGSPGGRFGVLSGADPRRVGGRQRRADIQGRLCGHGSARGRRRSEGEGALVRRR